jgi:hypothetical protein
MSKYENGKIYVIKSKQTDDVYIGSTIRTLKIRLSKHKNDYKRYMRGKTNYISSFEILKYADCYIELICKYPTNSKKELEIKEGLIIKNTPNCCNERIAGRTPKEYYNDNKETIDKYNKKWRLDNDEKVLSHKKKYADKMAVKITCECGIIVRKCEYNRHQKSKLHLNNGVAVVRQDYNKNRRVTVKCPICEKEMSKASLTRHTKNVH